MKKNKKVDETKEKLNEMTEHCKYLERKLIDRDSTIREIENARELLKEKVRSYEGAESIANHSLREQAHNLMEVIRWNINPRTAEFPFEMDKNQRDDNTRSNRNFNCRPF